MAELNWKPHEREAFAAMSYEELKELCTKKNDKGRYTRRANMAYEEIQRRQGGFNWQGRKKPRAKGED